MKIRFEREEVQEIVRDFVIQTFGIDLSGKQCEISDYYGGVEIEITDRQEKEEPF